MTSRSLVPGGRVKQRLDLALSAPAKRIELRYHLGGITVRSVPSRAGRALTAISPLVAGVPKNFPVAMLVNGSTVLNIECPSCVCASRLAPPANRLTSGSGKSCHGAAQ